jgi:hypothetical protein
MLKCVTNSYGVTYYEVWEGDALASRIYKTAHPTIPFEAYPSSPKVLSKRVMTLQEGEDYILSPEDHEMIADLDFGTNFTE